MRLINLFIISIEILSSHIVCDAEIPNNTKLNSSQIQNNSNDNTIKKLTEDEIRQVRNTWMLSIQDYAVEFRDDILLSFDPKSIWYLQCSACTLTPERYFNYRMQRNNIQVTSIL
ncbi:GSCOCG00013419001-RA-CDS [Cotesia congregata]|nr:GSCOCG00013419001-RA-CDS [Cotesia congregata]